MAHRRFYQIWGAMRRAVGGTAPQGVRRPAQPRSGGRCRLPPANPRYLAEPRPMAHRQSPLSAGAGRHLARRERHYDLLRERKGPAGGPAPSAVGSQQSLAGWPNVPRPLSGTPSLDDTNALGPSGTMGHGPPGAGPGMLRSSRGIPRPWCSSVDPVRVAVAARVTGQVAVRPVPTSRSGTGEITTVARGVARSAPAGTPGLGDRGARYGRPPVGRRPRWL